MDIDLDELRDLMWKTVFAEDPPEPDFDVPVYLHWRGQALPDLNALPPERWLPALRPLTLEARVIAANNLPDEPRFVVRSVVDVLRRWEPASLHRQRAVPTPGVPAPPEKSRHLCFRLTPDERRRLEDVAARLGMSAARLAKSFTLSGLHAAEREATVSEQRR